MPRHARLRAPGLPMHVVQRGNNRDACFAGREDRTLYLGLLREHALATGCEVHAYVLMDNHVHLLLTGEEAESVSRLMKAIGERYVRLFNKRQRRTGTLWEGRFRSSLVETETYLLTLHRYIELNPVRAGMVAHPAQYEWSSHRANAEGRPSLVLAPHATYLALGPTAQRRQRNYRRLFENAMQDAELAHIRRQLNCNYALGSEAFLVRLEADLGQRVAAGRPGRPGVSAFPRSGNRGLTPVSAGRNSWSDPGFSKIRA